MARSSYGCKLIIYKMKLGGARSVGDHSHPESSILSASSRPLALLRALLLDHLARLAAALPADEVQRPAGQERAGIVHGVGLGLSLEKVAPVALWRLLAAVRLAALR